MPSPMIWPGITGSRLAGPFPAPSACPRPSPATDHSVYVGYPPIRIRTRRSFRARPTSRAQAAPTTSPPLARGGGLVAAVALALRGEGALYHGAWRTVRTMVSDL